MKQIKATITNELDEIPRFNDLDSYELTILNSAYSFKNNGQVSKISNVRNMIKMYPHIPELKYILARLYEINEQYKQNTKIQNRIRHEHPEFYISKYLKISLNIDDENMDALKAELDEFYDISNYSDTNHIIHTDEAVEYYRLRFYQHAFRDEFQNAEKSLDLIKQINPDFHTLDILDEILENQILISDMTNQIELYKILNDKSIEDMDTDMIETYVDSVPEIFYYDHSLPLEIRDQILQKPRENTINLLENVLLIAIISSHETGGIEFDEYDDQHLIHALILLGEFKSSDSLPIILDFLALLDDDYNAIIIDMIISYLPSIIFNTGNKDLDLLYDFIIDEDNNEFIRLTISEAVGQMVLHDTIDRESAIAWYDNIIDYFLENQGEVNHNVAGCIIAELADIKASSLLNKIQEMYERNLVDISMCGSFKSISMDIRDPKRKPFLRTMYPILQDFKSEKITKADKVIQFKNNKRTTFEREGKKIGRNDPCPCGSGAKYKHCCLKN